MAGDLTRPTRCLVDHCPGHMAGQMVVAVHNELAAARVALELAFGGPVAAHGLDWQRASAVIAARETEG